MTTRASLFAIAVLFLYGSPAQARTHVSPPGNSGASQYQEDVPSAGGGVPVTDLPAKAVPAAPASTTPTATTPSSTRPAGTTPATATPAGTTPSSTRVANLPTRVLRSLARAGRTGRQAAALADRTAPSVVGIADSHRGATTGSNPPAGGVVAEQDGGAGGVGGQVASAVVGGGGGGLGVLLPLVLGASLVGAVAVVLARRRRSH
jgi:hypothetical protein